MKLTGSQKKFIKRNIKTLSLEKISSEIGIGTKDLREYLSKKYGEKYPKIIPAETAGMPLKKTEGGLIFYSWLKENRLNLLILSILVVVTYLNSLGNAFVSDDITAIRDNPNIGSVSSFWSPPLSFNPQMFVIFIINKVFGLNPIYFRLLNLLAHLGSTLVILFLVNFFFGPPIPLISASLFAVHPILSEAVVWISALPYSLSAFFTISALALYLYSSRTKGYKLYLSRTKGYKLYLFSLASYLAGCYYSEKILIFPLVLLIFELSLGNFKKNWPKLVPFLLISFWRALYFLGLLSSRISSLETVHHLKPGINNPLVQIPIAISSYLQLILWPKGLTLYHSEMLFSQREYLLRVAVFLLFLTTTAVFVKKEKRIFFWLSFFLISLLPTLVPLRIAWIVAERYIYLGSLGIFVVLALLIQKVSSIAKKKEALYALLTILILCLSIRTIIRNSDWKNEDTLWLAAAKTSPSSSQNHNNLGDYYSRQGDLSRAEEEFKTAIMLNPDYAEAYHNLGNTYEQMEKEDLAIKSYQKAISISPNLWQPYYNLSFIYARQGETNLAKEHIQKAISLKPDDSNLHFTLGVIYLGQGEREAGLAQIKEALRLDPQNRKAIEVLINYRE